MNSSDEDRLVCPECKEHCGLEQDLKQCEECKKMITDGVAWFALRQYGKELCLHCQLEFKRQLQMDKVQDQGYRWGEPKL